MNVGFSFWRDKYLLLGKFHNNYLKRFPVPFDSVLSSRDVVAESKESKNEQRANDKAATYFQTTFVCDGRCRKELEDNDIFMTGIDVKKEAARLELQVKASSKKNEL